MTDTETTKAATPDETASDAPASGADATTPETDASQSFADATSATPDEIDTADRFYTTNFTMPGAPESSPDGQSIAFLQRNASGEQQLWVAPTDGGAPRRIDLPFTPVEDTDPTTGRIIRGPQWSPDGTRLAVTGMHPDGDRTAVWIVPITADEDDPATTGETPTGTAVDTPEIPDAPIATAESEDDVAPVVDDSTEVVAETHHLGEDEHPEDDADSTSASSPGDDVVGSDDDEHPLQDEAAIAESAAEESRARGPHLLVDHAHADRSPRWSPDGVLIAMVSTVDGHDVIALTTAEGGDASAVEMLTWSRSDDREPVWSRDGKLLAFLRVLPEGDSFHDIYAFSLENGELQNLTSGKSPAVRHSLEWVPGRNLVAYVTRENDWLSISVINADNKAGWTVTRESGDKTDPRFAQDEARMVYVRTEGFTTVLCERSLHSSSATALDPGEGVVRYPRWLEGKRVAYAFSAPQRPVGFLVQENTAKSDRIAIVPPEQPSIGGQDLRQPQPFEFSVGPEEMFSGMLYRTPGVSDAVPGIVYLPDGPLTTRRGEFQIEEQALASSAMTVLTPVIHGASGFGAAIENDLREFATTELESNDIAEAGRALGREERVDADRLALVGHGFGGALALVTAGARPGVYRAVVAIDPIAEWSEELAGADVPWRTWVVDRFGMPLTHADHYALRSPATFSAVIDVPLVLVRTARAPRHRRTQFDMLTADLDEVGVDYRVIDAPDEPLSATLRRVGRELAAMLVAG